MKSEWLLGNCGCLSGWLFFNVNNFDLRKKNELNEMTMSDFDKIDDLEIRHTNVVKIAEWALPI